MTPEEKKAYNLNYYRANREKYLAQKREYYERNKAEHLRKTIEYAKENRAACNENNQRYRDKNKEVLNARARIKYAERQAMKPVEERTPKPKPVKPPKPVRTAEEIKAEDVMKAEKAKERSKRYYEAHKEEMRVTALLYYHANKPIKPPKPPKPMKEKPIKASRGRPRAYREVEEEVREQETEYYKIPAAPDKAVEAWKAALRRVEAKGIN